MIRGAARAAPFFMPILVSGGDGTLFHFLRFLRPPFPEIVIAPTGRGNALARDLRGLRQPVPIDLIEVEVHPENGEPFVCHCASSLGFGYSQEVTRRSLAFRRLRRFSYAAASTLSLPTNQVFLVQYDHGEFASKSLTGILVNNTRHIGGFVAFPDASCRDGILEAMETRSGYASQMAHNLSSMARSGVWMPARVSPITSARIKPAQPQCLMLDGELVPAVAEVRLRVLPGALRCAAYWPSTENASRTLPGMPPISP